jgi:ABC-2 type transport system ATP-binding protein
LAGELDALLAVHHWVAGPRERTSQLPRTVRVISRTHYDRHSRLLVRSDQPPLDPELAVSPVDIEDLVLAYLDDPELHSATLIGSPG